MAAIRRRNRNRVARFIARRPLFILLVAGTASILLAALGLVLGKFSVSANNSGWRSRGTTIANRDAQVTIVQ